MPAGSPRRGDRHWVRSYQALLVGVLALCASAGCSDQDPRRIAMFDDVFQPLLGDDGDRVVSLPNTIVNTYSAAPLGATAGTASITVSELTSLGVNSGDLVLIIQMQGASIDKTDSLDYGKILDLGGAGRHEVIGVVGVDVISNTVRLNQSCGGLKNSYDASGHVQVVRIPQFASLQVAPTGSITAPAWDGEKGGIVAIYAKGEIYLEGNIDVSGKGFRGGRIEFASLPLGSGVSGYRSLLPEDGGDKGESVAGVSSTDLGARSGRGAPANGGGGGNSHGGGGGGGANVETTLFWTGQGVMDETVVGATAWQLDPGYQAAGRATSSAGGGRGGYTSSQAALDPTAIGPGSVAWLADRRREVGGLGGRSLNPGNGARLFFGGGGGAGDGDSGPGGGGSGGGIALLVGSIVHGSGQVRANGSSGLAATAPSRDGGGGGGGGGAAVVIGAQSLYELTIVANGGSGGNQGAGAMSAAGPGGGGSGGFIATFGGSITRSVTGGSGGVTASTELSNRFPSNGATAGQSGQRLDLSSLVVQTPELLLPTACVPSDVVVKVVAPKDKVNPGDSAGFVVSVKNSGPQYALGIQLGDIVPAGVTVAGWTCTPIGRATCPFDQSGRLGTVIDLPPGTQLDFGVTITVPADYPLATLEYGARFVTSPGFSDTNNSNNSASAAARLTDAPAPDLTIAMSGEAGMLAGTATQVIQITNRGPGTAGGIILTFRAPDNINVVAIAGDVPWTCAHEAHQAGCLYEAKVPPGELPPITVTVGSSFAGPEVTTEASVIPKGIADANLADNMTSLTTPISSSGRRPGFAGGGFGCALVPSAAAARTSAPFCGFLTLLCAALCTRGTRRRLARRDGAKDDGTC